tara:strand:- start:19 stop:333 length:315 start_codon:yes stop_codon:yes gene_type:complete
MRKNYRKSKKSYPNGILLITDSGSKFADRYAVFYEPYEHNNKMVFPYVAMDQNPYGPNGFGQHGELSHRYSVWGTNDKAIDFENLPIECQKLVMNDLNMNGVSL